MTETKKTLKLRKCAYIFDIFDRVYYYGTAEQIKKQKAIITFLKTLYDDQEKRNKSFNYTQDKNGHYIIEINGEPHTLNDMQILTVSGDTENIINHRKNIDGEKVADQLKTYNKMGANWIINKKFKSLWFEFFTGPDDLGYTRTHFQNNKVTFIVDDRNGELYTAEDYGKHKKTTEKELLKKLGIKSTAAKNEFLKVMELLKN